MKPGDRFTDEQVRRIKRQLMAGSDPVAIARILKCSANTIRRIKTGETYNHVPVDGEDDMRRPLVVEGVDEFLSEGAGVVQKVLVGPTMTKEDEDILEQHLLEFQAKHRAGKVVVDDTEGLSESHLETLRQIKGG